MTRQVRRLLPWELHCGCPTCGAKPRGRCVTTRTRYPPNWSWRPPYTGPLGKATTAHKSRYELWCYLFGQRVCTA